MDSADEAAADGRHRPAGAGVAQQASTQAGYPITTDGDDRAGVVLGTCSAGGQATTDYLTALFSGGPTGAPALLFNSTVATPLRA